MGDLTLRSIEDIMTGKINVHTIPNAYIQKQLKPHLLSPVKRRIRAVTSCIRYDDAYVRNYSFDSALC